MNESAYMDDVTWEKFVAVIGPGILKMPMSLYFCLAEWIGERWVTWRGGLDHSTIVFLSLFVSLSISNYDVEVVRDYPNWEVICTKDGFKLHKNVTEALKTFTDNKIRYVKEEGVTIHFNHLYDQCRAVEYKNVSRQMIDLAHGKVHDKISQWHLIGILCVGIKYCKETTWVNSFKTVNIHPHHCFSFEEWVHCISSYLKTGEKNFHHKHQDYYYDA